MFSSVVLDVDSTLCGIEGIDFLAARRSAEVGAQIARVTERAMQGELPLEEVYGAELAELVELGLVERDAIGVRLTERGRMLGNQVFQRFV